MPRKLCSVAVALAFAAAACGGGQAPATSTVETSFVPQVVDFLDDVGIGPSIALDAKGEPYLSYLGFTHVVTKEEEAQGILPPVRPVAAPRLPAVLVARQVKGLWTRAAAEESSDQANGPQVPIDRQNDTATAVDGEGTQHVAWTETKQVAYASDAEGQFPDKPETIDSTGGSAVSIAVDEEGTPWVAYVSLGSVRVATKSGKTWSSERVASGDFCQGCPAPATAIAVGAEGPVVAYSDLSRRTPTFATRSSDGTWSTEAIEQGVGGYGVAMSTSEEGAPVVSYVTSEGEVHVATRDSSGSWSVRTAGRFTVKDDVEDLQRGTAVGLAPDGTMYVAWGDPTPSVHLVSSKGDGAFSAVPTEQTDGGTTPALALSKKGKVFLAWFDTLNQDLVLGTYPEKVRFLAVPSPSTEASGGEGPGGPTQCEKGTVQIEAPVGASGSGFKETTLTAKAGTIDFCLDNEDVSVPHNFTVFKSEAEATAGGQSLAGTETVQGPAVATTSGDFTKGEYFYVCTIHLGTMTGTLKVS